MQLKKYSDHREGCGIQLGFPKAKWSEPYFDAVWRVCERLGLDCFVGRLEPGEMQFLVVDFGTDVSRATECVRRILADVFEVGEGQQVFCKLYDAASAIEPSCSAADVR